MQKLINTIQSVIIVVALSVLIYFGYSVQAPKAHVGDGNQYTMYAPMNNTQTSCTNGASTLLIATSTSRQFLRLTNTGTSSTAAVWLSFGTPAATGTGAFLNASSSLTFDANSLFAGAIYCLGQGANVGVAISEAK